MRIHKYINDPKELLEQGKQIVSESADNKFVHRVSMVNLILGGLSPKVLSEYCGDSERVLQTWVKNVDESGWDSLIAIKQSGRPSRLTDQQIEEIHAAINAGPDQYGYNVWDGPALSDFIKKTYHIDYGVRACQLLMRRMGFSLIRPQMYPSLENPDDEACDALKKTDRTQPGRKYNTSFSGRGSFPGSNYNNTGLGRERIRTKSHVKAGQGSCFIQWFCHP